MDYDASAIATIYDSARGLAPELLERWLDLVARDVNPAPGALIVDVGCGTGRFSGPLAERFAARVLAVDPSISMLTIAREKTRCERVTFHQSAAEALPLAPATAEVVFLSMVFHHFHDASAAIRECRRVVRVGGHVCVRTITRDGDFPHRHFFPINEAEFPTRHSLSATFAAAGFSTVAHEIVTQVVAATWPAFVGKIALRGYSTVASLSDQDFETGMAALQAHTPPNGQNHPVTEDLDWFVFKAP